MAGYALCIAAAALALPALVLIAIVRLALSARTDANSEMESPPRWIDTWPFEDFQG